MPHPNHHTAFTLPNRDPAHIQVYLIGSGIASLASAVHLIHDAHMAATSIHILESSSLPGGAMDGGGSPSTGYVLRGGRMLNFSYRCTYHLLSLVPSLGDPEISVREELEAFNKVEGNRTEARARLVVESGNAEEETGAAGGEGDGNGNGKMGGRILDVSKMGFHAKDRQDLLWVATAGEERLGTKRIDECFRKEFFETPFWYMWCTTFAFEPWHSAVEFKRYLHRFIQEFPRINTLSGVDRTPYNQFDSIILPIETYLKALGVDFKYDSVVTALSFTPEPTISVSEIHYTSPITSQNTDIIHVHPHDLVFVTLGSMSASSSLGTNTTSPSLPINALDPTWRLWSLLASPESNPTHYSSFGHPSVFSTRAPESSWLSFTTTLTDSPFISLYEKWSSNKAGTGALVTFRDSNWLLSIVVPHQPHFLNQPGNVHVIWGYGLFPFKAGNFIKKPMAECSGSEIWFELLSHLGPGFISPSPSPSTSSSTQEATPPPTNLQIGAVTIPCMLPYITSQFLTRAKGDRPLVIPHGSQNLALLGQFVEIEGDTVFTVEYSVRAAQMAVHTFMKTKEAPIAVYKGDHDPVTLVKALAMLMT